MIDLREHLQELADAAARHGSTPGPAAAIHRGRQRRRRIAGVVAAVLAVTLAVGSGVTGRLVGRQDLPATSPVTTLPPLPELDLLGEWPASAADEAAGLQMEPQVRGCPGGIIRGGTPIVRFRSAEYRRLVFIGGKPPASGETTVCWAVGIYDLETGAGKLSRPVRPVSVTIPGQVDLTADLDDGPGYGAVYGQVDRRAYRVRVRFTESNRPILDVAVIQAANQYLVNFYVGLFPRGWTPGEVTAFDAEGRQLAGCSFLPYRFDVLPPCPGK